MKSSQTPGAPRTRQSDLPELPTRRRLLGAATAGLALGTTGALAPTLALADESAPAYAAWSAISKGSLSDLDYLVLCATLAPSPHNTQPWKFRVGGSRVDVLLDRSRSLGAADAERRMQMMGIGAAIENLGIAAQRLGLRARVDHADANRLSLGDDCCASLSITRGPVINHPWFGAIFRRQTTRSNFDPAVQPPSSLKAALANSADLPGVHLTWFDAPEQVAAVAGLTRSAVRDFLAVDARHRDGTRWFRRTRAEWEQKGDGIAIFQNDVPFYVRQFVEHLTSEQDMYGADFKQGEIDGIDRMTPMTARWGLIHADSVSGALRLRAGQYAERVYLEATAQGFGIQPVCYPTEVPAAASALATLARLPAGAEPLFLFRLGKSDFRARSVRRPLTDVIERV